MEKVKMRAKIGESLAVLDADIHILMIRLHTLKNMSVVNCNKYNQSLEKNAPLKKIMLLNKIF